MNNGLLPVQVSEAFLSKMFEEINKYPNSMFKVDLVKQTISIISSSESEKFDISSYKKTCLINGYDDIDYLLSIKDKIEEFENAGK